MTSYTIIVNFRNMCVIALRWFLLFIKYSVYIGETLGDTISDDRYKLSLYLDVFIDTFISK